MFACMSLFFPFFFPGRYIVAYLLTNQAFTYIRNYIVLILLLVNQKKKEEKKGV